MDYVKMLTFFYRGEGSAETTEEDVRKYELEIVKFFEKFVPIRSLNF